MGFDKALLPVGGAPNATRLAAALAGVASPVIEVGPGFSGLRPVQEEPRGAGPLLAVCAGVSALGRLGHEGPVLVVACDMPFVTGRILRALADFPGSSSVVPCPNGRPQPLCARWAAADLALGAELAATGARAMKALLSKASFVHFTEDFWPSGVVAGDFADVDTPEDRLRLGLAGPGDLTRP